MIKQVRAQINGTWHTLTLNTSTGRYEATITAPSVSSYNQANHYYPVTVEATDAGNNKKSIDATDATLGSSLRLVVKEKVAPVITIVSPTADSVLISNTPVINWKVTDNDSGVNADSIVLAIDGTDISNSAITKNAIEGGYNCTYTPTNALVDGSHTLIFNASDNDGNAASAVTISIKIDTVPPTLTISEPTEGLITNAESVTVSGVTNDTTSSPVTVTVNNESVTVNADGSFSTSVTFTSEGSHTITIIATDAAGKTTTITRNITIDRTAPVITGVTLTPNPVDAGATYIISVTVTD